MVLDANVLVAYLDEGDALHGRSCALLNRLKQDGTSVVLLDFLVEEAWSALARRAHQRKASAPDLRLASDKIRAWKEEGRIETNLEALAECFEVALELSVASGGRLNFNDAKVVYLVQRSVIALVATFDSALADALLDRCVR